MSLVIVAVLIAAMSQLHAAKLSGGRQGQVADGSFISARVDGQLFTYTLMSGDTAEEARDALVAIINMDDNFTASSTTVPLGVFESDDVFYEVLTASGFELDTVIACENDANYTNSGVHFPDGKSQALVRSPTSVAGDGEFDLRLDMVSGPDVHLTIPTGVPDLVATIISELVAEGFAVSVVGRDLQITKAGDNFLSVRVESTDSSITHTCARMRSPSQPSSPPSGVFPMMSQYALFLLVVGLLLAGIVMIRRKMAAVE